MNANRSEFAKTRDLFAGYTGYKTPLSYDQWLATADDRKSAVLFCQFFDTITLVWYKLASVYSTEEDGVAEVMQYLEKNVPMIMKDKKRFTPAYIYKVVYNCLYCLCRDPNRYKQAYENETSNIATGSEGDEFDLFDSVGFEDDYMARDKESASRQMWKMLEGLATKEGKGKDYIIVIAQLLGDNLDFTGEYHPFDFRPDDEAEVAKNIKVYKKSEDCSPTRVEIRKSVIRSKYGEDFVSEDFVEEHKLDKQGKPIVTLKYSVREERQYKGIQAFTPRELASVSDSRRAEIIAELATMLAPFKELFI